MRRPASALSRAALAALALSVMTLGACGGGGGHGSEAPTLYVTTLADSGPGSLRQAVIDGRPGATVAFDPALAGGTVTFESEIDFGKPVRIDGSGPGGDMTLDGDHATRLFTFEEGDVELRHLILRN